MQHNTYAEQCSLTWLHGL